MPERLFTSFGLALLKNHKTKEHLPHTSPGLCMTVCKSPVLLSNPFEMLQDAYVGTKNIPHAYLQFGFKMWYLDIQLPK